MNTPPSTTFVASDADNYERLMGRWSARLAEPFLDFAGLAAGDALLDVGCGTGSLSAAALKRAPLARLHGFDLSPLYVDHAARRVSDPRASFATGDACAIAAPDASFDRVYALLVLHFVPGAARAIAEMRRVAKPGATVAAAVWDARGGYVANRIFFDTAAALDPSAQERRARNYTRPMTRPGELGAAWRAAGLTQVEETALAIRMEFTSFDDYWTPYEGRDGPHGEYLASLDAAMRDRVRQAVRLAYLGGEDDGPRSLAATAWAVKGVMPR